LVEGGDIWWADLGKLKGSGPGFTRPVVVIQSQSFNSSRIQTAIVAVLSFNMELTEAPGNVAVPTHKSGLPKDSVINVSQLLTLDRTGLRDHAGQLDGNLLRQMDQGLRLALSL
jgi:mRNA interferase MazF